MSTAQDSSMRQILSRMFHSGERHLSQLLHNTCFPFLRALTLSGKLSAGQDLKIFDLSSLKPTEVAEGSDTSDLFKDGVEFTNSAQVSS